VFGAHIYYILVLMKIMFVDGFVETAHIGVAFGCYQLPIQRKAFKAL